MDESTVQIKSALGIKPLRSGNARHRHITRHINSDLVETFQASRFQFYGFVGLAQ